MRLTRPGQPIFAFAIAVAILLGLATGDARAIDTNAEEAILVDYQTGAVLFEKNADRPMPPSSMSKLMTVYMVFERLKDGSLSLDDQFNVSEKAWRMGGSKMFVEVGKRVRVEDLLRGIIVQSGNDACVVVAENLSTSEEAFAQEMTRRAGELGLENSTFVNASGWPDPRHMMTARDLAILAKRIVDDFPEYYPLFAEKVFTFSGITQYNRNKLLWRPASGVDGLKTGHTEIGGYGLVASAERNGRRLILVVNGLKDQKSREVEPERLLQWGFREFENYDFFAEGEVVEQAEVWLGKTGLVPLVLQEDLMLTLSRRAARGMEVKVVYDGPVPAPIEKGQRVATLKLDGPNMEPIEVPLVAGSDVERLGFVGRLGAAFRHILWGFSS